MLKPVLRWVIPLTALLIIGPLAGSLTASLRDVDGSAQASLLLSRSPARGVMSAFAVMAMAAAAGGVAARLLSQGSGFVSAGLVLAWAAWGTGDIDGILRRTGSASALTTLALEGLLVGALSVPVAFAIILATRRPALSHGGSEPGDRPGIAVLALPFLAGLGAAALAGWLVAQESLKGQTVAAGAIAGLAGAGVGRLVNGRSPTILFVGAIALLAAAGPLTAFLTFPKGVGGSDGGAALAALTGRVFNLARPLPLDWIAGGFLGIPVGVSWTQSMTEMPLHPASPHPASRSQDPREAGRVAG